MRMYTHTNKSKTTKIPKPSQISLQTHNNQIAYAYIDTHSKESKQQKYQNHTTRRDSSLSKRT